MNRAWCCAVMAAVASAGCTATGTVRIAGVAQVAGTQAAPPASAFEGPWPRETLSAEWMDYLLSPVALYPDPLLAQMLPASTYPVEVVRAKRLIDRAATTEEIDATDLDVSIKALTRYPDVIVLMDEHIEWTERLGQAFIEQQEEVMNAVQRLRAQASAIGNLRTNEQQTVYYETEYVRIVPTTEYVYIPTYDWSVVYTTPCARWGGYSYYTFSTGCLVGSWLNYDCDWRYRRVCRPCGWTWWDYCRRDRGRHHHGHHGRGHGHDREAFAYSPRAPEHNGEREDRIVRPEPGPLTPDEPVVRDDRKPGSPGGRPRERVAGVAPRPVPVGSTPPPPVRLTEPRKAPREETPGRARPIAREPDAPAPPSTPRSDEPAPTPRRATPAPPPPPPSRTSEPPKSAPPAQRVAPPVPTPTPPPPPSQPPAKAEKPGARASDWPVRGEVPMGHPPRTDEQRAAVKPRPTPAPTPVVSARPLAPRSPAIQPRSAPTLPPREAKREAVPPAPPPAVRVTPPPPPPVKPRMEAPSMARETPRAATPPAPKAMPAPKPMAAPKPVAAPSKPRMESSPPPRPARLEARPEPGKMRSEERGERGDKRGSRR